MRAAQDYFALFGLSRDFNIDISDLEKRYFLIQRELHPDRLIGKSAQERTLAISRSMTVNSAYETLKSPLKRAWHMLAWEGIAQDSVKPSQDLLMETMQLREELAEAETEAALNGLETENTRGRERIIQELAVAFADKDYPRAAQTATHFSYLGKALEEIKAKKKIIREKYQAL